MKTNNLFSYVNVIFCRIMRKLKFIIMDFEFSILDRTNIVLVLGAMVISLDWFRVVKLEGPLLVLSKSNKVITMDDKTMVRAIKESCRIFKEKPEHCFPYYYKLNLA